MIRKWAIAAFDRGTSIAVGFALAFIARTFHIVVDPQSELGYQLLAVGLLTAQYDLAARWVAKRYGGKLPWLPGVLGVTVKAVVLALMASIAMAGAAAQRAEAAAAGYQRLYCHEHQDYSYEFALVYAGSEFAQRWGGGTRRLNSSTVRIQWVTAEPEHVDVLTDDGGVIWSGRDDVGGGTMYYVDLHAVLSHWWSIRSYALGSGGTIWQSSLGMDAPAGYPNPDNHCGSGKPYIS